MSAEESSDWSKTPDHFRFSHLDMEKLRAVTQQFVRERDWEQYHTPRNLLLALTGEVGELAELFQWKSDQQCQPGLPGWSEKEREKVKDELSDVLVYLIRLSERCNIDLTDAVMKKIEKNGAKYPADRVRGSSKKYNEYKFDEEGQQLADDA
eukprot:TRINITY_DN7860_c0_g2_i7.p1 TRINITY_DN7860_c0_g2~~TRINITY_DN7860_c0_g2_i7.p1  ORF type:complete len:152 (-),score=36.07 TRINITY_DN7860_c0_g2_i7:1037-1492(-)